jgi:hypothetical protein
VQETDQVAERIGIRTCDMDLHKSDPGTPENSHLLHAGRTSENMHLHTANLCFRISSWPRLSRFRA